MRAAFALVLLFGLAGSALAGEARPFAGVGPLDPQAARSRDAGRMARFEGLGRCLAATSPVAWGSLEPTPQRTGAPSYDWTRLDEAVLLWQLAGLDPVLVLSPDTSWGSQEASKSAWHAAVRKLLPEVEAAAALRGLSRGLPPKQAMWGRWERFVRDVAERYDGDGAKDMPGLRRPVRHLQVLAGVSPTHWLGDAEQLLRLLHHAMEGLRAASKDMQLLAPTVDLRATGHAPFPDAREWAFRIGRITPSSGKPLGRLEMQREFALAQRILGMPRLFDILCHAGAEHLADDVANLSFLRRTLDNAGGGAKGLWLLDNPTRKLGTARDPNVVPARRDERRLRERWLPPARNPRHSQHGRARDWLRRGQAYDLVRGLCRARAAGADAVLFLAPWDTLPAGHHLRVRAEGQGLLVEPPAGQADKGPQRSPSYYAFAQAMKHLAGHASAGETRIGSPGWSVIFQFEANRPRPWTTVLLLDPRLSWAGEPGKALPERDVLVTIPRGTYTLEWVQTGPKPPRRKEIVSDGAITVPMGPEPVYVIPKR